MFIRYVMFAMNCDTPRSYTAHTNKTPVEWFDWSPLKGSQIHSRRLARAVASKTIQELAMTVSHGLITIKRIVGKAYFIYLYLRHDDHLNMDHTWLIEYCYVKKLKK